MIKTIIKNLIYGIAGACILFVMTIIFWDLTGYDRLQEYLDNFSIYALGFIVICTGFSMSSIVYEIKRLPLWLKFSINMLVGFGIFFFVGPTTGIFSLKSPMLVLYVAMAVIIFIVACFVDHLFIKREAKKMNEKVKERKAESRKEYGRVNITANTFK